MTNNRFLFLSAVLFSLCMASCGEDPKTAAAGEESTPADSAVVLPPFDYDTLKGIYYGDFGGTELRIVLNYVSEGHAVGYSIVKGLQRNISGKVLATAETIDLELSEPGDNKYDGLFKLSASRQTLGLSGTWTATNTKFGSKSFTLTKLHLPKEDEGLSTSSFARLFYMARDETGEFSFDESGLCTYTYYPSQNEEYRDQKEEFTGSWSLKGHTLTIDWQENPVFPSRKSIFEVTADQESYTYTLEGEGRTLYSSNMAG